MAFGSFEVHAGDFKKGKGHQLVGRKLLMKNQGWFFRETILLDQIETVEVASEEAVKRIGGTVGWGAAGGVLLGPIGLLAGLLAGGQGKNVTFVCKLRDGRKFMATAPSKVFTELSAALFKSEASPSYSTKPKRKFTVLKWIVGIFVAFIALGAYLDSKMTPEQRAARAEASAAREAENAKKAAEEKARDDEEACADKTMAFVMSQNFVKRRLKAPASADFPYDTSDGVKTNYLGDCIHQVVAYVDSQNSFGATIRTRYYVKLKYDKGTASWELLAIRLGQ